MGNRSDDFSISRSPDFTISRVACAGPTRIGRESNSPAVRESIHQPPSTTHAVSSKAKGGRRKAEGGGGGPCPRDSRVAGSGLQSYHSPSIVDGVRSFVRDAAQRADINRSQAQAEQKLDKSAAKANKLQDQIEQAAQKLKGKQTLDWQDKKMLEDIVQQKESLNQMLEELKAQNKLLEEKKEAFTKQDERIREKAEQVQKLMEELLDDETKKLFDELQKLLNENKDSSQIQKLLDKLDQNTNNLDSY